MKCSVLLPIISKDRIIKCAFIENTELNWKFPKKKSNSYRTTIFSDTFLGYGIHSIRESTIREITIRDKISVFINKCHSQMILLCKCSLSYFCSMW